MKQRMIIIAVTAAAAVFALAACANAPQANAPLKVESEAEVRRAQTEANVENEPFASRVLDWQDRNLGEVPMPVWIRPLARGNSQLVRQEFGIRPNARVKMSQARMTNRNEARVQSALLFNAQIANELKTYVVTAAAQTLNQGQMDIVEEITTATKINITGNERVADFWQLVETTDDRTNARVREYIYYIVWTIDSSIWDQLVYKYVNDVIGQLPDRQVQINIANAYDDIAAASRREIELSDRDFQRMVNEQYQAAENAHEREMARIRHGAQVDVAQARADAAARYAAYRSGDPVAAAVAAAASGDVDWIRALRTVASIQ